MTVIMGEIEYNPETGEMKKHGKQKAIFPKKGSGYLVTKFEGKEVMVHRLIFFVMTGEWPPHFVDHRNGIRTDNRWCNLRLATRAENNRSRRPYSKTGFKGVYAKRKKFQAQINFDGRERHLGIFETKEAAARAYDKAARENFGEFALTNFPNEVA